jgi:hypothetical protein
LQNDRCLPATGEIQQVLNTVLFHTIKSPNCVEVTLPNTVVPAQAGTQFCWRLGNGTSELRLLLRVWLFSLPGA